MRSVITLAILSAFFTSASAGPRLDLELTSQGESHLFPYPHPEGPADSLLVDGEHVRTKVVADTRPVAIAIVYCGWTFWVGRDELPRDPGMGDYAQVPGALNAMRQAMDDMEFNEGWPSGSEVVVISYGNGIYIKTARRRIDPRVDVWMGDQSQFDHDVTEMLMQGLDVTISQVSAAKTPRRAIIVLGNGVDNGVSELPPEDLRVRLIENQIELRSIIWHPDVFPDGKESILAVAPDSLHVATPDGVAKALTAVVEDLRHRSGLVVDARELPWDGGVHTLELRRGATTVASTLVWFPAVSP